MSVSSAYKGLVVRQCQSKICFSSFNGKHQNGHVTTSSSKLLNEAEDNTQSWNKSPFFEFIEKTIVRRMEYLLERTSYMEEMRKAKNNMMHVQRQMYENSEKRHAIIMQLNDGKWDTKLFEGVNNELILKNIAELSALEKNLWNLYNKVEQEETSLLTKYTLASNEFYEAERMYRKILNVGWVFTSLVTSLLGFIVSNLWLFYHQSKAPSSELPKIEIKEEKNNQDSWTSYLHRNLRWTYSWTERFNK